MNMTRRAALRVLGTAAGAATAGAWAASEPAPSGLMMRLIPSSGEGLPAIGLGTWQTFDVGTGAAERAGISAVLSAFVEEGGRVLDSSPMYGRAETVAGDLMAEHSLRDRVFVATKVWTTGREAGVEQMEQSFRRLRVDRIDLLQVHNLVDVQTHLATLRRWQEAGRVRYVGVTHYTTAGQDAVARLIEREKVDFIQINYSVGEREAEQRLLPLARDRGVAVIVNRPFAGGDLFRRLRERPLPAWAAEIDCTSWAQLLLKFVISHPAVTCAIPATSRVAHLRDNMGAGRGRLPDAAMRQRIAAEAV